MGRWKDWLEANHRVITALAALTVLMSSCFVGFRWAFKAPDVAIRIEKAEIELPPSIIERMVALTDSSVTSPLPDTLRGSLTDVYRFLALTKNISKIAISNNTSSSVTNIDVRIINLSELFAYAVGGDALTAPDLNSILQKMNFDPESRILTIRGIERLPPKTTVELFIWGDERLPFLIDTDPVTVTYDGGSGELIRQATVYGFDAFVYSNAGFLVVILVLLDMAILLFFLDRLNRNKISSPS